MKVFLSSPFQGLEDERQAVSDALEPDYEVVGMEHFGSSGLPPLETCLRALSPCRACVVIVGGRYGSRVPGLDISYSEAEYEHAQAWGIQTFAYINADFDTLLANTPQSDDDRQRQGELKDLIESEVTVNQTYYTGRTDLAQQVRRDLDRWAAGVKRPKFKRRKFPVRDELAYSAGRLRRALGTLYPFPIVLVDIGAAQLPKYPSPSAGRIAEKVHRIYWEMQQKGAQIAIFNDLPVLDTSRADIMEQRLQTLNASEALVVCFVRRASDIDRLDYFASAGRERALWIAVWVDDSTSADFPASYRDEFTSDELNQCLVGLRATEYLRGKLEDYLVKKVSAARA